MRIVVDPKSFVVSIDGQEIPFSATPRFGPPLVHIPELSHGRGPVSTLDLLRLNEEYGYHLIDSLDSALTSFTETGHWVPPKTRFNRRDFMNLDRPDDLVWVSNEELHADKRRNPGRPASYPVDLLKQIKKVYWSCKPSEQRVKIASLAAEYSYPRQELTMIVYGWNYWYV